MFSAIVPTSTPISRDHNKKLVKIIQALLTFEESNIFRKPIAHKALGWDDYKQIVKKPIDLNYVRRQYNEGKYKFVEEVLDQIQLIWQNVFLYGKREHETFDLAIKMQKHFDELLNDFLPEYFEKINRVQYFKRFQQTKPEKKNTSSLVQQKNTRKIQKMDVEIAKEQLKAEMVPETILSKKNNVSNLRRTPNAIQSTNPAPNAIQENKKQANQKSYQMQSIIYESKRRSANTFNAPQTIPVEQIKQQTLEPKTLVELKKQHLTSNKQSQKEYQAIQNATDSIVEEIPVQSQQISHNQVIPQPLNILEQQYLKPEVPEPIENEDSQENLFPPIMVTLNKKPSSNQIEDLTNMMNLLFEIQEFDALSKVVRILTKYEKENMVIDGENVNFKMDQIHISTYNKIKKDLEIKFYQLQHREKVKDLENLMVKYNVKSFLINGSSNPNQNGLPQDLDENFAAKVSLDEQQPRLSSDY